MTAELHRSPLLWLIAAAGRQLARRPYLSLSVALHAALLALLYGFGSYQLALSQGASDAVEVASSLRATHEAGTAKRLQDLQTIKELLEKSAGRDESPPGPGPAAEPPPQTPEEALARARELARKIETLDKEIQAEELAKLTGPPKALPADEAASSVPRQPTEPEAGGNAASRPGEVAEVQKRPAPPGAEASGASAPVTAETAAGEVAELEAKARATLAKRLKRLEAKQNGVQVEAGKKGSGEDGTGNGPAATPAGSRKSETARAEIAEFVGRTVEQTTKSRRYTGSDFFDHGNAQIPALDASSLVRGHGRMFGAGGEYANRVYLNSWYLIGPFAGRHEAGLFDNPAYPPEKAVLLDAVYYGKDQRVLRWRYVTAQSYPLVPPDSVPDSVYYGYTEVSVDQDCDLTAWIGADDDVQVYLNDRLVWKGGNVNKQSYFDAIFNRDQGYLRDYNRTEGRRVLHFNKGRNKLFFKLSNGPNGAFLSMVLTR
ncbi:hypothetical protein J2X20_004185 [Pelomonas saccharophila]|uniref:PA14 domain-containing protein n=1 Tax=Roseateles saccharophilus TaxID=304 RepID=A0ABU1YRP4_ROSSA|nr:hypothetical protein [Roseateles saccharophilus]MDR7271517.1 hypothetical protein [Roseateles saccharophilus]